MILISQEIQQEMMNQYQVKFQFLQKHHYVNFYFFLIRLGTLAACIKCFMVGDTDQLWEENRYFEVLFEWIPIACLSSYAFLEAQDYSNIILVDLNSDEIFVVDNISHDILKQQQPNMENKLVDGISRLLALLVLIFLLNSEYRLILLILFCVIETGWKLKLKFIIGKPKLIIHPWLSSLTCMLNGHRDLGINEFDKSKE